MECKIVLTKYLYEETETSKAKRIQEKDANKQNIGDRCR